MKVQLPRYTSKDYVVLGITILPLTLAINSVIFGSHYYSSWQTFLFATIVTSLAFSIDFTLCGAVAVLMKKRFPTDSEVGTRLTLMIFTFITLTGLFLFALFKGYELFPFLDYSFNEEGFVWAYIGMGIVNIFLTFLHEGIARYENWKVNLRETEAIKKVYRQSRLQGLKSQINPHILFNSLNCLSSLIHEDSEKSEKFLDEMSKVYRYMLQSDEEELIQLDTELKFMDSYVYLLQARHSEGLKVITHVSPDNRKKFLPPLTLQTIIENTVTQNSICRDCPLVIEIRSDPEGRISVRNNVLPRMSTDFQETESGLDNLVKKYRLLNQPEVEIDMQQDWRTIRVPLIDKKEELFV